MKKNKLRSWKVKKKKHSPERNLVVELLKRTGLTLQEAVNRGYLKRGEL